MSKLTIAALLCCCASSAFAADCSGLADLRANAPHPRTYLVSGPELLAFGQLTVQGCPQGGAACAGTERQLHPGTVVIVTSQAGPDVCASILGDAPDYPLLSAFVPKSALVPGDYSGSLWTGSWRYSIEQQIVIKAALRDQITVDGDATWGMFDPQRVANGGVKQGSFHATVRPKKGRVAFTQGDESNSLPYDPTSTDCSLRLWLLGPYLAVVDNDACGGANVTFTGLYTHGSWAD